VGVGHRAEEQVHDHALAASLLEIEQAQGAVGHRQMFARRDDVNVVRLHLHRFIHLDDRHFGDVLQQRSQDAFVFGRKMEHHHEGHAAVRRHLREKSLERPDASGGPSEAHHRQQVVGEARNDIIHFPGGFLFRMVWGHGARLWILGYFGIRRRGKVFRLEHRVQSSR
jgi:hypothetical protein